MYIYIYIYSPQPTEDLYSVALRWLIHHSLLRAGDGVILGLPG